MRAAWGKTDKAVGSHPLAHHSMDVAAVFQRILQLPVVRDRLEVAAQRPLTSADCQRLAALAFLHDIGKLHPGFQAKGWPDGLWTRPVRGHSQESWAFLQLAAKWPQHPFHRTMQSLMGCGPALAPLIAAMFAHHGRPVPQPRDPTLQDWDRPRLRHYDWRAEARTMADALCRWFPRAFDDGPPLPDHAPFHHAVAGYAALADWIGSDTRFFKYVEPLRADYDTNAHRAAQRALAGIGLDTRFAALGDAPEFHQLTQFANPNPAQAMVGSVRPETKLVILESETGSGKTEAALWRFTQLLAAGKVSGMYFAVPTRAAARQLHGRVQKAMDRVFGASAPDVVLAIPGILKAGEHEGQRLPHWQVKWDDDAPHAPMRWAAEHATRFLAATVAVGPVDQAMLAGLQVKHAHLRGSAMSRNLLVVDEVHASDAYMTEVLKHLLDGHLAIGGYAMLMSATLGARARVRWRDEAWPTFAEARKTPYPAVWAQGSAEPNVASNAGPAKIVHPETIATMDATTAASRAIAAAERGARVLVIRNTVTQAVETWRSVLDKGAGGLLMQVADGPALHHGRFATEDRALLDGAVERALATDKARAANGCIVIGTQTLEQSLDIDADLLITDLCPMDVLLQRIGRLHRHDLPRPAGFEDARAFVLLPAGGLDRLSAPAFDNGLGAWKTSDGGFHGIYSDLAGLELTRRLLEGSEPWRIPDMNRTLVEGATHWDRVSDLLDEKGEAWRRYDNDVGGAEAAHRMLAKMNVLDRKGGFLEANFPGSDERIMTRLGEEGAVLEFDPPVDGPFGTPVTRIALPARWSQGISRNDRAAMTPCNQREAILSVGERTFRYSRAGLMPDRSVSD